MGSVVIIRIDTRISGIWLQVSEEDVIPKYIYVDVWAKTEGRAGYENKYEMPPPIDELIFYGNIALVARMDNETAIHLTTELWNIIYEKLFGGFDGSCGDGSCG